MVHSESIPHKMELKKKESNKIECSYFNFNSIQFICISLILIVLHFDYICLKRLEITFLFYFNIKFYNNIVSLCFVILLLEGKILKILFEPAYILKTRKVM